MYNRYDGNSGRYVRIDDAPAPPPKPNGNHAPPQKQGGTPAPPPPPKPNGNLAPPRKQGGTPAPPRKPERRDPTDIFSRLIPNAIAELDTEDIILMLVLYLMYRESGDKDLLIMMGSLFLP